ncbi:MAG: hypothetical protein ACKO85_17240 [Isosphaeraceae bacterium]
MQTPRRLPQILALVFSAFLAIFAADVFEGQSFSLKLFVGLFIHLLPSFLVLFLAWLGGRFPIIAAACFCLLGVGYMVMTQGRFPVMTQVIIGGPPILIGLLFLNNYYSDTK